MNTTHEEALLKFINEKLLSEISGGVDALTPLFREGGIDSLKIIQLIAFVEILRGENIPDVEIVMDRFQNVRAICEHFLNPAPTKCL